MTMWGLDGLSTKTLLIADMCSFTNYVIALLHGGHNTMQSSCALCSSGQAGGTQVSVPMGHSQL